VGQPSLPGNMVDTEKNIGINVGQTLGTVGVLADMLVTGRKMSLEALKQEPYIPEPLLLALKVRTTSGFDDLNQELREKLATTTLRDIYGLMERRASLQKEGSDDQLLRKKRICRALWNDRQLDLDPGDFEISWGMFSYLIVTKESVFKKIRKSFGLPETVNGVTGRIEGELGLVPICLRSSGRVTIEHEDLHVFQSFAGDLQLGFDFVRETERPEIKRLVDNRKIKPGDLEIGKNFLAGVLANARQEIMVELRTYSWEKRIPVISLDDNGNHNEVNLASSILNNAIFFQGNALPDEQKLLLAYEAMLEIGKIAHLRNVLWAMVKQAVENNRDKENPWEWAASRLCVIPAKSSVSLIRAVLLGRGVKLKNEPKLDYIIPLPQALITMVRRRINPKSYGQGEMIQPKQIEEYIGMAVQVFKKRDLCQGIVDKYHISGEQMMEVRKNFIRFARISVPEGFRGKVEKELKRLISN